LTQIVRVLARRGLQLEHFVSFGVDEEIAARSAHELTLAVRRHAHPGRTLEPIPPRLRRVVRLVVGAALAHVDREIEGGDARRRRGRWHLEAPARRALPRLSRSRIRVRGQNAWRERARFRGGVAAGFPGLRQRRERWRSIL